MREDSHRMKSGGKDSGTALPPDLGIKIDIRVGIFEQTLLLVHSCDTRANPLNLVTWVTSAPLVDSLGDPTAHVSDLLHPQSAGRLWFAC